MYESDWIQIIVFIFNIEGKSVLSYGVLEHGLHYLRFC